MNSNQSLARRAPIATLFLLPLGLLGQAAPQPTAPAAPAAGASPVVALDAYQVTDTRPEPFGDRNVDAPRTVNDVQPYMIFNAKVIEESGAINMEDFLRNNLTMVNERGSNAQNTTSYGASSDISLRGLSTSQTLVLIDGRRLPNVFVAGSVYQPDLNGIPMAAIDRIEVLPSSASGIYGGSAVAGVINVILKKSYSGGEVRLTYDTPMDTDASIRTVNVSYGRSFENGRSHLTLTAQYSDAHALVLGDRKDVFVPRVQRVLQNAPDFYWTATSPFLGAGVTSPAARRPTSCSRRPTAARRCRRITRIWRPAPRPRPRVRPSAPGCSRTPAITT